MKERVLHIMNKKILAGLLAIILVLSLVLVGCSKRKKDHSTDQFAQGGVGVEDWDENEGGVEDWDDNESNSSSSGNKDDNNGGVTVEDWDDNEDDNSTGSNSSQGGSSGKPSSGKPSSSSSSSSNSSSGQSSSGGSSVPTDGSKVLTYSQYIKLSPAKQQEYFESFKSYTDFISWYNKAKKEYDAQQDSIRVEGGDSFDISDYIKE